MIMKNRLFLFPVLFLVFFSCNRTSGPSDPLGESPNILLILVDDMGFSDLGCYGSEIETPNIDGLAVEGIRFTQFHNTAKCFPSRASLLTGVYAQQCGMDRKPDTIRFAVTLGEVLREAGYRTLAVGKHHGSENLYNRGFDRYFGLNDGACNFFNPGNQRPGEPVPAHKTWAKPRMWAIDSVVYTPYTPEDPGFYTTDAFTDYALQYLEEYRGEDRPFFLYAAYNAPHDPLHAWPEDIEKYLGTYMDGYEAIRQQRYRKQQEIGLIDKTFPLSEPTYADWSAMSREEQVTADSLMATYAAMIDRLDWNIGRIIRKLKETGDYQNTLILFMSDNGANSVTPPDGNFNETAREYPIGSMGRWASQGRSWANVSNTPFRFYKSWSHEGGVCTPLLVSWPALNDRFDTRVQDFPSHFIDIMPTILDITGASYPETYNGDTITPYQGISLLPVWKGEKTTREKPIFWQWARGKGVYHKGYKLVSDQDQPWELYHLAVDRTETRNLADSDSMRREELVELYNQWWHAVSR